MPVHRDMFSSLLRTKCYICIHIRAYVHGECGLPVILNGIASDFVLDKCETNIWPLYDIWPVCWRVIIRYQRCYIFTIWNTLTI